MNKQPQIKKYQGLETYSETSKIIIAMISFFLVISCTTNNQDSNWSIAFKNDKDGNVIHGSKNELINAIRNGADIRIGWGSKGKKHQIEHLSDPIWIAILDEKEIMIHLHPQVLSSINWDKYTVNYADSTLLRKEWRVVLTTKGEFDAVWYDRKEQLVSKRIPQNHVITWFVRGVNGKKRNSLPFFNQRKF